MSLWSWLAKLFKAVTKDILPIVHDFLNALKSIVESPLATEVTALIPGNIDDAILSYLKQVLPQVCAEFGIIVDLTNASTADEVNAELQKAFAGANLWANDVEKQKFLSTLGARIFTELHALADGTKFTFGQAVTLIEGFYQGYFDAEGNPVNS